MTEITQEIRAAKSIEDLRKINPLIDDNTIPVQSVLSAVSRLFFNLDPQGHWLGCDDAYGLGLILDTCRTALEKVEEGGGHNPASARQALALLRTQVTLDDVAQLTAGERQQFGAILSHWSALLNGVAQ